MHVYPRGRPAGEVGRVRGGGVHGLQYDEKIPTSEVSIVILTVSELQKTKSET